MVATRKRSYPDVPYPDVPAKPAKLRRLDPNKPPKDEACPLMALPGELLNQIYGFTLSEPGGLHYATVSMDSDHDTKPRLCTSKRIGANMLQYTSKQLRNDTRGLGLRFNHLIFKQKTVECTVVSCATFLEQMAKRWYPCLRNIFMVRAGTNPASLAARDKIVDICRSQPTLTVKCSFFTGWTSDTPFCAAVYSLIIHTLAYRGYAAFQELLPNPPRAVIISQAVIDCVQHCRNGHDLAFFFFAPNFRFFPCTEGNVPK